MTDAPRCGTCKWCTPCYEGKGFPCLPEHAFEIAQLQASLTASEAKYHELIMAVGNKYPDETRHQTALRYIRQSEQIQGPITPGEE